MIETLKPILLFGACIVVIPFLIYFCVKFGTVAYYRAKQFMEKEEPCCDQDHPSQEKCDQCQETDVANPHNH